VAGNSEGTPASAGHDIQTHHTRPCQVTASCCVAPLHMCDGLWLAGVCLLWWLVWYGAVLCWFSIFRRFDNAMARMDARKHSWNRDWSRLLSNRLAVLCAAHVRARMLGGTRYTWRVDRRFSQFFKLDTAMPSLGFRHRLKTLQKKRFAKPDEGTKKKRFAKPDEGTVCLALPCLLLCIAARVTS